MEQFESAGLLVDDILALRAPAPVGAECAVRGAVSVCFPPGNHGSGIRHRDPCHYCASPPQKPSRSKRPPRTGAVTLIQRFGSALNLNIHFHMLFLDGFYVIHPGRIWTSEHLTPPPDPGVE